MRDPIRNRRTNRRHFQFSVRMLLLITAVAAVAVAIYVKAHRDRTASRRPMLFLQAVQKGDLAEVDRLLKIDPKLAHGVQHGGTSFSHTPLQLALGKPPIFDRILEERPDLDERSSNGRTALDLAVTQNMVPVISRLLRLAADPNALDNEGRTCLHDAAEFDPTGQITKLLLDAGADPNNTSDPKDAMLDSKSPLHRAAQRGHDIVVAHLLSAAAQTNLPDINGRTALHYAVAGDHSKVASLLIEHGADLTAKDNHGLIPGERADGTNSETAADIWWHNIEQSLKKSEVARLNRLLDSAPQALSFRTDHLTMYGRALYNRRLDVLDYLLDRHADPEVQRMHANRYLHWACADSPADFAKRLFDAGADIEAKNEFGQTPLHAAASAHNHDVLRMLLAKVAEIGALDHHGTAVLDATFERSFHDSKGRQTLDLLRGAGHPPTILYAAATGDLDLLQELTGDNVELLDRSYTRNGIRPLHAAVLGRQSGVIEWLFAQGVEREPLTPPYRGSTKGDDTPLMVALGHNVIDIAILLIENGASVNRKGSAGYYPLHYAIHGWRDPAVLEVLLAHGADPSLRCQDQTAAELAKETKSEHRERYLELLSGATSKSAAAR